jgi:cytoskeletal protein RodZ
MRSAKSEHILLVALLAVPLAVVFLGWPAFARWAAGPSPAPTPEVAGASATSAPPASAPTRGPTPGVPATVASRATAGATLSTTATPGLVAATQANRSVSKPAANAPTPVVGADDPGAAVQAFYARVAAHDFDNAASL